VRSGDTHRVLVRAAGSPIRPRPYDIAASPAAIKVWRIMRQPAGARSMNFATVTCVGDPFLLLTSKHPPTRAEFTRVTICTLQARRAPNTMCEM